MQHILLRNDTLTLLRKLALVPPYLHAAACQGAAVYSTSVRQGQQQQQQQLLQLPLHVATADDATTLSLVQAALLHVPHVHSVAISVHADIWTQPDVMQAVLAFVPAARSIGTPVVSLAIADDTAGHYNEKRRFKDCSTSGTAATSTQDAHAEMTACASATEQLLSAFCHGNDAAVPDNEGLHELDLGCMQLTAEGYAAVTSAVRGCGRRLTWVTLPQVTQWPMFSHRSLGAVLRNIAELTTIQALDASGCCMGRGSWEDTCRVLQRFTGLRELILDGRAFVGRWLPDPVTLWQHAEDFAAMFQRLGHLTKLRLNVTDDDSAGLYNQEGAFWALHIVLELSKLTQLQDLSLAMPSHVWTSQQQQAVAITLQQLGHLQTLELERSPAVAGLVHFCRMTQLTSLSVRGVHVDQIHELLLHLRACRPLKQLSLHNNAFTDTHCGQLQVDQPAFHLADELWAQLQGLQVQQADPESVTDIEAQDIDAHLPETVPEHWPRLELLRLVDMHITDSVLLAMAREVLCMPRLRSWRLHGNTFPTRASAKRAAVLQHAVQMRAPVDGRE